MRPSSIYPPPATPTTDDALYVIIPCLNEEDAVQLVAREVLAEAPRIAMPIRVILVDDGSTDQTRARMEELCAEDDRCELIANERNLGVGRSVMQAYERIPSNSWVTAMPGDNEIAFAPTIQNFLAVHHEYDLILGYLHNPVIRPASRRLASFVFHHLVNSIYGFPWTYLNGPKLYRIEVFRGLNVRGSGHAYTGELVAKAQLRRPELRIGEAPFVARGRAVGASTAVRPQGIIRAVRDVYVGATAVSEYRRDVIRAEAANEAKIKP